MHFSAKPIDLLAKYISSEEDDLAVEMHEPYTYLYVSSLQNVYYGKIAQLNDFAKLFRPVNFSRITEIYVVGYLLDHFI